MSKPDSARPKESDKGKRAWAWPLPGNHPSQIRTGVLLGWDSELLRLEISGTVHGFEWEVLTDWGIGKPPNSN